MKEIKKSAPSPFSSFAERILPVFSFLFKECYQVNGLGKVSDLCTPHQEYLSLGKESGERQKKYLELLAQHLDEEVWEVIRTRTHKGMAVGNDRFKNEGEALTGRRLKSKKKGRPVGW